MGFSNTQVRKDYNINGKKVTNINDVFKHMEEEGLTSLDGLLIADKTIDSYINETPDDGEFIGIPSLVTYNATSGDPNASELGDVDSSSGVLGGETTEAENLQP